MSAFSIENTELWKDEVEPYVLEQYRESARWIAILKGVIDRIQDVDDAAVEFQKLVGFTGTAPAGYRLDFVAGLVNVKRISGESDTDFLARFKAYVNNRTSGTPDNVILKASSLAKVGEEGVHLIEEEPGVFLVYTPEGRQIERYKVSKLAPAGVMGAPAAALVDAKGRRIVDGTLDAPDLVTDEGDNIVFLDGDESGNIYAMQKPARLVLCVARDENIGNV